MYLKQDKRAQQAARTRRAIYESACRLFAEKGFNNVTVKELCVDAGVSTGAYYHHFTSKADILMVYRETLDEHYLSYYDNVLCSNEYIDLPIPKKLTMFIAHILSVCVNKGVDYERIVYSHLISNALFSKNMVDTSRNYFKIMNSLVSRGQEQGSITSSVSAEQIVHDLTILLRGCIVDWCVNDGAEDIVSLSGDVVSTYIRGIHRQVND